MSNALLTELGVTLESGTCVGLTTSLLSIGDQEEIDEGAILVSKIALSGSAGIYQFGKLTEGKEKEESVRISNARIIQKAIDTIGQLGGGIIYIPAGYYQVSPETLTGNSPSSIVINHDNITLIGDGIGKTIIESRGSWSVINNKVVRGNGIMIRRTNNPNQPRKNITIKNLELSGGTTGFTGNKNFPANTTTGDGWDITHKGIALDFVGYLDNVIIDSVCVHDFKGEVIYAGGIGVGDVTISNTKLYSSNGSILSLDANLTVTKCEFSQTANAWVENAPLTPNKIYSFDQCIFKDSIASGLVVAQGDLSFRNKVKVTNCEFYNSNGGICPFGGAGNFVVTKNKFFDVNNVLFTSGVNENIEFFENEIYGEKTFVTTAHLLGKLSNVVIKNNRHQGSTNTAISRVGCVLYYGHLQNIIIENNIFENCRTPEQPAVLTSERPLFRNNQYINVERRDLQGSVNFWRVLPSYIVEPKSEEVVVLNNTSNPAITIEMSVNRYVDGQEVLIVGGSASDKAVVIPQNSTTIECQTGITLRGRGQQVRLRFDRSRLKWFEVY